MTEFKENSAEEFVPNITLDIGAGAVPTLCFYKERISELLKNPNKRYILLDSDEKELNEGKHLVEMLRNLKPVLDRIEFVCADGGNIPVEDSLINEVVISNVFGDPTGNIGKVRILKEVDRVLKHGGTIKVIESYTPGVAQLNIAKAKKLLVEDLGYDLIKEICVKGDEPLVEGTDSDAFASHEYSKKDTFIWEFRKK